ncbi:hypothetical protein LCGC14_1240850, partial [marine sediment metagenome]
LALNADPSVQGESRATDLSISANTIDDTAIAFSVMSQSDGFDITNDNFDQINYQVDFDFIGNIGQSAAFHNTNIPLSQSDINDLFDNWKSKFSVEIDNRFNGAPVYIYQGNRFVIGKQENVYDRFIPLMGVYENSNLTGASPISSDFKIKISGDNDNVRHFVLCLLPEKVCFKAENSQTEGEFTRDNGSATGYLAEEKQEFYTGKAELLMLFNTENSMDLVADEDASYSIVRRIGPSFDFNSKHDFKIMINYTMLQLIQGLHVLLLFLWMTKLRCLIHF